MYGYEIKLASNKNVLKDIVLTHNKDTKSITMVGFFQPVWEFQGHRDIDIDWFKEFLHEFH